jgi:hypothetical protein
VSCGPIEITATRPGVVNSNPDQARIGGAQHDPLVLTSGSPSHDVRIQIAPASAITGKVVDDHGDPIMGAQVTVLASRVSEGRRN